MNLGGTAKSSSSHTRNSTAAGNTGPGAGIGGGKIGLSSPLSGPVSPNLPDINENDLQA